MSKTSHTPLYTLILLHYRQEWAYREALDSIFSQTYENIELIIADDASPYLDKEELFSYVHNNKKSNIRNIEYIFNDENTGTTKILQKALKIAKGKYIHFFAADDALSESLTIEKIVTIFENLPEKNEVLATKTDMMDFNLENVLWSRPTPEQEVLLTKIGEIGLFEMTALSCVFGISSMVFKKKIFNEQELIDPEKYKYIEDWPLILRITRNNIPIVYHNYVSLNHRDGGISNRLSGAGISNEKIQFLKENILIQENEIIPYMNILPGSTRFNILENYIKYVINYEENSNKKWKCDLTSKKLSRNIINIFINGENPPKIRHQMKFWLFLMITTCLASYISGWHIYALSIFIITTCCFLTSFFFLLEQNASLLQKNRTYRHDK